MSHATSKHATHPRSTGSGERSVEVDGVMIPLRNPALAAFLAWLIPGAGHLYQGRRRKGWMFMACILTLYFFGFSIGGGHVVYASWVKGDYRWHYLCQLPVGIVAFPALIEGNHMRVNTDDSGATMGRWKPLLSSFMTPPRRPISDFSNDIHEQPDELASWYAERGAGYEMGTWYTMIAGLLNILVIFDAYAGPLAIPISGKNAPNPYDDNDTNDDKSQAKDDKAKDDNSSKNDDQHDTQPENQ